MFFASNIIFHFFKIDNLFQEMKQAVPPPLTAIQTPRTEESGFPFPDDSKEVSYETFQSSKL